MSLRRALAIPVLVCIMAGACTRVRRIPSPDIVGTWIAQAGRYKGRAVTITKDHVILFMGGNNVATYPIKSVRTRRQGDSARVDRITYNLPGGGADRIELERRPGQPDVAHILHAGNSDWVRSRTSEPPIEPGRDSARRQRDQHSRRGAGGSARPPGVSASSR